MTTTINKTDGSVLAVVPDGSVNLSSTNLALVGRLFRNYGELINENLVKLLENFANASSPSTPIVGQLWFDTGDRRLKVFRSTGFVPLAVITPSTTQPGNPAIGDFWYDTVDAQLKIFNGATWIEVAPGFTASQGRTGAFAENIADTLSTNHIAVTIRQSNQVIAIFSNDNEYTPQTVISGFPSIKRGLNLSNSTGIKLHGIATDSELLNGLSNTQFIRNDINGTATGTITLTNTQPLVLGANNQQQINVTAENTDFVKTNPGAIRFYLNNTSLAMQLNSSKQIVAEQGNASTPSITFNGDTDTGLNWVSPNTLGISAGGVNRLTVDTTGISVNGQLAITQLNADSLSANAGNISTLTTSNLTVTTGNISTLTTSTLVAPTVNGVTNFANNVGFNANVQVSGNTLLGTVGTELLVQFNPGTGIAGLRVDSSGRILINVVGPTISASNPGDMTLSNTAHVHAANTAKWWIVWKDGPNPVDFEILGGHQVDSITRVGGDGEYKINLEYNMTPNSFWSVVGMGARGNMNMLEFPVGGDYVRVINELYDFTGTDDSSYNSVVAHGI